MSWQKFIGLGAAKGEEWDREISRIWEALEGTWGVPKLIFVRDSGGYSNSDTEDFTS